MPCFAVEPLPDAPFGGFFPAIRSSTTACRCRPARPCRGRWRCSNRDRTHRFWWQLRCAHLSTAAAAIVRHCSNDACGREHFPRVVSPVVIMAVERGEILRRSHHFAGRVFSALALVSWMPASAEQARHREIFRGKPPWRSATRVASQPWLFIRADARASRPSGLAVRSSATRATEDAAFFHVDRLPKTFRFSSTRRSG